MLAIVAVVFATLGIFRLVPYTITMPITMLALGLTELIFAYTAFQRGKKVQGVFFGVVSCFVLFVLIFWFFSK